MRKIVRKIVHLKQRGVTASRRSYRKYSGGEMHACLGRFHEAEPLYHEALAIYEREPPEQDLGELL